MLLRAMTADVVANYLKKQIRAKYKTYEAYARSRGMSYHSIKSIFYRRKFPRWMLVEFGVIQITAFKFK